MASEMGDTSGATEATEPAVDGTNSANSVTSEAGDGRNDSSHPREVTTLPARESSAESEKRAAIPMSLEERAEGHHRDSRDLGAKGQIVIPNEEKTGGTATVLKEAAAASVAPAKPTGASEPPTWMDTEDGSPSTSERVSKKRPREEGPEEGTSAAAAATTEASGEETSGREGATVGDNGREGGQLGAMVSPDTPKPLEDPRVKEVVSQDLATQQVKRVRRTDSNGGPPPTGTPSPSPAAPDVAPNEHAKGQQGGDGDGSAVANVLENGTMPAEQRPRANGAKADERGKEKEGEESGLGGQKGREGTESSGGSEPSGRGTGDKTGGKSEEASQPKDVGAATAAVDSAAGDSSAKDTGTKADGESPKLNGGLTLLPPPSPSRPSNSVAMPPPTSSTDPASTSSADACGEGEAVAAAGVAAAPSSPSSSPSSPSVPAETRAAEGPSTEGDQKVVEGGAESSDAGRKPRVIEEGEEPRKDAGMEKREGKGKGRAEEEEEEEEEEHEEEEEGKNKLDGTAAAAGPPAPAAKRRSSECPDHALPVARTFFDFESVSGLEMRLLPEFFTGRSASKTSEMYMQSRNYMVRSYQRMLAADADGQAFLTGTECRRKLAGDACSILRIHEFLDRFGLINTRTAGKRPVTYPVAPPSMHLWRPTPPLAGPPPSRRASGEKGSTDTAGAASASASPSAGREVGRRGAEAGASSAAAVAGGMGAVGGYGNNAGGGRRGGAQAGFGPGSGGGGAHDEREWRREELVVLMEAAVANPHQWDAVAHAVGGGRTPAACMRRFLTLAVEEVVEGEHGKPAPASTTEAGAAPVLPADGNAHGSAANGGGKTGAAAGVDQGGLRGRAERQRPAHLGQAVPALVLASALVSNVDSEVLMAAMSAAADAADAVARRSVVDGATGDDDRGPPRVRGSSGDGGGRGATALERDSSRSRDGDEEGDDVEMRDVDDGAGSTAAAAAAAAVRSGRGESSLRTVVEPSTGVAAVNDGRTESGTEMRQQKVTAAGGGGGGGGDENYGFGSVVGPALAGAARAAVLSVAGLQARELAKQEERRTEALLADLLEARVQRLETKLHCFDELDQVLNTERESLEHDRAELLLEQARSMLAK